MCTSPRLLYTATLHIYCEPYLCTNTAHLYAKLQCAFPHWTYGTMEVQRKGAQWRWTWGFQRRDAECRFTLKVPIRTVKWRWTVKVNLELDIGNGIILQQFDLSGIVIAWNMCQKKTEQHMVYSLLTLAADRSVYVASYWSCSSRYQQHVPLCCLPCHAANMQSKRYWKFYVVG